MKGDFSKWEFDVHDNYTGVLHQQGRALIDQDWNASNQIVSYLRKLQGRDAIGPNVAAVPAEVKDSFRVIDATAPATATEAGDDSSVIITLHPGRVWVDGLVVQVSSPTSTYTRTALYLAPPIQDPQFDPSTINVGVRDAVILEIWEESLSAFQDPTDLIEPALGGVDTTERVKLFHNLRLLRLEPDDNCGNLADKLADDFENKGKLTVTPAPDLAIAGECPVEAGGGYTGFEHYLFRIEIAEPDGDDNARFKWSRFDGGLVGRGTYDSDSQEINILANDQMINHSGLNSFYLEALQEVPNGGGWAVEFTANTTLSSDGILSLTNIIGNWPGGDGEDAFFRLWDGIALINDFQTELPTPNELVVGLGIRLEFEPPIPPITGNTNYTQGDYWTFPVRAAGVDFDPSVWPTNSPPQGIHYHRVPLTILTWNAVPTTTIEAPHNIHECRHVFQPLSKLDGCCSYTVGDGMRSHGDYESIQEAIDNLPSTGGEICLLPGIYKENVTIASMENVVIKGCDKRTVVMSAEKEKPIFHIIGSKCIALEHMDMEAYGGTGIFIESSENGRLSEINVINNRILACINAIRVEDEDGEKIKILSNTIRMLDKEGGDVAIFIQATDSIIEDNDITVIPADILTPEVDIPGVDPVPNPTDPCADPELFFLYRPFLTQYVNGIWAYVLKNFPVKQFKTPGGIQVAGRSEGIKVSKNRISGGYWNGITLGHIPSEYKDVSEEIKKEYGLNFLSSDRLTTFQERFESFIEDLTIEGNEIRNMGLNGMGVVGFFSLKNIALIVSVEDLTIYRNHIEKCLQQIPSEIPTIMKMEMGFGGISLSDCENLVIRENRIEDNGKSHIEPVSGIFILHGEKIDISDNRILNNGPRTSEKDNDARPGFRGGIVIGLTFKKAFYKSFDDKEFIASDGIPSVKIHDNIVTQPLGQALFIKAFGPVSVVGNHLTSQGADYRVNPLSLIAGAVFILNLGVSKDLIGMLLLSSFKMMTNAAHMSGTMATPNTGLLYALYLPSGNVLFSNNQTTLDLRAPEPNYTLSSQFIASLDDVSYVGNQSECSSFNDLVISNTVIFGVTVRTNDNRFQEGITMARYSLFSYGLMNTCATNQATHCLHVLGNPSFRVYGGNKVLMDANCKSAIKKLYEYYNIKTEVITTG